MTNKPLNFALAGLLHDIGKFGQRADINYLKSDEIKSEDKEIAGYLCKQPKDANYFTHLHVSWTKKFIESYLQLFEQTGFYDKSNTKNNLVNLAAYHHKPATIEHAIITMADHWSSGIDRNKADRPSNLKSDKINFRTQPLISIFNEIATTLNPNGIDENLAYPLQEINISDKIFPIANNTLDIQEKYTSLWKAFNTEISALNVVNEKAFIYSLYHLLKKYLWYIPAATNDYPNCSLFEHSKITGAVAHCLAAYFEEDENSSKKLPLINGMWGYFGDSKIYI
jgi:CRISPR-associated protein Csm1